MSTSPAAPGKKFTDAERREIVERFLASGQTAVEFAPSVGVSIFTIRDWRLRFAPDAPQSRRPAPASGPVSARPAFVEIAARPDRDEAPPIVVALPRGIAVRVAPGFDSDTLRRVVDSLIA